jgi:hypothetical protein
MGVKIEKKVFETADAGLHNVKITSIEDLGLVEGNYGAKEMILVKFEVLDQQGADGTNLEIWGRFTKKTHEKSTFGKLLAALKITPDDVFDTDDLLGARLQVVAVHNKTASGTYANIETFIGLKNKPAQTNQVRQAQAQQAQAQPRVSAAPQPTADITDEDINF